MSDDVKFYLPQMSDEEVARIRQEVIERNRALYKSHEQLVTDVREALIEEFQDRNIETVDIRFYGSGDDGNIEEIIFGPTDVLDPDLEQRVEDWAYKYLDTINVNWVENDGGDGVIKFNMNHHYVDTVINQNEIVSHEAFAKQEDI
jgi:hypothetical protein